MEQGERQQQDRDVLYAEELDRTMRSRNVISH
jgi:hypothetical protein